MFTYDRPAQLYMFPYVLRKVILPSIAKYGHIYNCACLSLGEPFKLIFPRYVFSNDEIKAVRRKSGMTQSLFAQYMGVSTKTVEAWELGRTHPTGPACRLLDILEQGRATELSFVRQNKAAEGQ